MQPEADVRPRAKVGRVWLALATPLVSTFAVFAVAGALLSWRSPGADVRAELEGLLFRLAFVSFAVVLVVTKHLARRDGLSLRDLGWRRPRASALAAGLVVGTAVAALQHWVVHPQLRLASPQFALAMASFGWDDALFLLVPVFAEDSLYRGYALTRLPSRHSMPVAFAVSVLAYALLSAGNGPAVFAWTVVMGVVFNLLFLRCRNLWPVAAAHYLMAVVPLALDTLKL